MQFPTTAGHPFGCPIGFPSGCIAMHSVLTWLVQLNGQPTKHSCICLPPACMPPSVLCLVCIVCISSLFILTNANIACRTGWRPLLLIRWVIVLIMVPLFRCTGPDCEFVGRPSAWARHVGSGTYIPYEHIWLPSIGNHLTVCA